MINSVAGAARVGNQSINWYQFGRERLAIVVPTLDDIVCATWNAVQCFGHWMMIIYMQLNTHVTAWAQAATWLTFLSVSPSLDQRSVWSGDLDLYYTLWGFKESESIRRCGLEDLDLV